MLRAIVVLAAASLAGCFGGGGSDPPEPRTAPRAAKAAERWPDGARYALGLRYDEQALALEGSERVSFANTGPKTLRSVWLRTWANAYGSCAKPLAEVRVTEGGRAGARRRGCTALQVLLADPLAPGERAELTLDVRITVPRRADRFGRMGDIAVFGNAIPLLAVADRTGWRLPPYTDRGESFFSLASSWDGDGPRPEADRPGQHRDRALVGRGGRRARDRPPGAAGARLHAGGGADGRRRGARR